MKTCTKCGEAKSLDDYYARGDGTGLRSKCKRCCGRGVGERARRRDLRSRNPMSALLAGMIQRCHNPKNPNFPNYGGRGIVVCDRWRASVDAFTADMGKRPTPKHTVERIDNDGPYSPENCRWATRAEQNRNTRQNVELTIDGETKCIGEWAADFGIDARVIRDRIKKLGWGPAEAVRTPVRACERRAA